MPGELAASYKSNSQRMRVVSKAWGEENLFCPGCDSPKLARTRTNTRVVDFTCPACKSAFQLKSQSKPLASRLLDAGYEAMRRAIEADRTPNLLVLHCDSSKWQVHNLILVPRFAFTLSSVEARKPLSPTARRKGYVGCFIVLANIPPEAKIRVVADGIAASPATVRRQYDRLRPLERVKAEARGWTLDVLNVVRALGKPEFTLAEVYAFAAELARLHPGNRHVRDKIRQQLQFLRDLGFVEFLGGGHYRAS